VYLLVLEILFFRVSVTIESSHSLLTVRYLELFDKNLEKITVDKRFNHDIEKKAKEILNILASCPEKFFNGKKIRRNS